MKKQTKTEAEQQETLNKIVNISGEGEDQVVRDLLSEEFVTAPDSKALDVGLALQQLIRGQQSILDLSQNNADELNRLRARMDEYDKASQSWEQDRQKFFTEVMNNAEKLRKTGAEQDKILASGANELQKAIMDAKAAGVHARLRFEEDLSRMPKETVVSPGVLENVREGGNVVPRLMPEEVRIRHKSWVLPPGQAVQVPKVVAEVLRQRRMLEQEKNEKEKILQSDMESGQAMQQIKAINKKYGATKEA